MLIRSGDLVNLLCKVQIRLAGEFVRISMRTHGNIVREKYGLLTSEVTVSFLPYVFFGCCRDLEP